MRARQSYSEQLARLTFFLYSFNRVSITPLSCIGQRGESATVEIERKRRRIPHLLRLGLQTRQYILHCPFYEHSSDEAEALASRFGSVGFGEGFDYESVGVVRTGQRKARMEGARGRGDLRVLLCFAFEFAYFLAR